MEPENLDKTLKRLLGTPRAPDTERMTARITSEIEKERERTKRPGVQKWKMIFAIPAGWRVAVGAGLAIVIGGLVLFAWRSSESPHAPMSFAGEAPNYGPPVPPVAKADALLARTDIESTLLVNQRHLVSNDPLLRPHSIWDQQPGSRL